MPHPSTHDGVLMCVFETENSVLHCPFPSMMHSVYAPAVTQRYLLTCLYTVFASLRSRQFKNSFPAVVATVHM